MTHEELCALLLENGFETGWCLSGETLTMWQHDENPPAPLKKPQPTIE